MQEFTGGASFVDPSGFMFHISLCYGVMSVPFALWSPFWMRWSVLCFLCFFFAFPCGVSCRF